MWNKYYNVTSIEKALEILNQYQDRSKIVAGATDLMIEFEKGIRKNIDILVDVTRIPGINQITLDEDQIIHLGPLVTHNDCASSKLIQERALPLAQAAWEVGSPQIRNRGTIIGNLITASPANDTITPLMALNAKLVIKSLDSQRVVSLSDFYLGVRKTILASNEMVTDIFFPALKSSETGSFIKFALRRAQAISLVNVAAICEFEGKIIKKATITLGAVAPTIIHAKEAEIFLIDRELNEDVINEASIITQKAARPISDIRGSSSYRKTMVKVITKRVLSSILKSNSNCTLPSDPVLLDNHIPQTNLDDESVHGENLEKISTNINGKYFEFENCFDKTLLDLLRDDAKLIGSKEGCAEGECGACTVFLDGKAVMACMVPSARAHGASIITIEGIKNDGIIHVVQDLFIKEGAVQCGYCTPGFIMSAVKLLEEKPTPSQLEIRHAISGNLCRCTGYYKIISAIEKASKI
ncbi:MAG: FAD binding domain-containing protein [Anaerolineaceae bacterium]|nr:FAD binding domain-containing protein [Anaerolineaceae bacterium]